jgi:hypothetical protein
MEHIPNLTKPNPGNGQSEQQNFTNPWIGWAFDPT